MNNIQNYYAVPALANVPVVEFGPGDFCYNGMRGLAGLGAPDMRMSLPWIAGAVVVGVVGVVGLVAWAAWK